MIDAKCVVHGLRRIDLPALALILSAALATACMAGCDAQPTETPATAAEPTTCRAALSVSSNPQGAQVSVDGASVGSSPLTLDVELGLHHLELSLPGYAPESRSVDATCAGQEVSVALVDIAAPALTWTPIAAAVYRAEGIKINATAEDNTGVVRMTLWLDEQALFESSESILLHNIDTQALPIGAHSIRIAAEDAAGNVASETFSVVVVAEGTPLAEAQSAPQPTPTSATAASQAVEPTPETAATSRAEAATSPTPAPTMFVTESSVTVDTYAYENAVYRGDESGQAVALLHRDQVGSARAKTYRTIVVRNEYLELTFLPELGGRLYQCRFLPTDQDLFYNNAVIKPTHWGPTDQGWWLAVGGMEFCLPVDEHGYVSAEPWDAEVTHSPDGSTAVTMSILEPSHQIEANVSIALAPASAAIKVTSTLKNVSASEQSIQYWINAMLSPGSSTLTPDLKLYYPASEVIVHSTGDDSLPSAGERMSWPLHDGRDLSSYATWDDWLGFFAPELWHPYTAVYDERNRLGMVRVFPPEIASGAKLFGFGNGFGDSTAYTDDGSQYIEMWGGWTPTFWDYATLAAGQQVSWTETWYPISNCSGVSMATDRATLYVSPVDQYLDIVVASVTQERWRLQVRDGDTPVAEEGFRVGPSTPYRTRIVLEGNSAESVAVYVLDETGETVISY